MSAVNVGAGLPANTVCQFAQVALTHRFREQARSHRESVFPGCWIDQVFRAFARQRRQ